MNLISKHQADLLAALAVTLRPTNAVQWDAAGVRAAIADVRHDHDQAAIAIAVIRLATNPAIRTPAKLANDGPHWLPEHRPTHVPPPIVIEPAPTGAAAQSRDRAANEARRALTQALTR